MSKKKFVPIPRAGKQGKDILALAQNVEQMMGARGSDLDSMPTWRDLIELGFVQRNGDGQRGSYKPSIPAGLGGDPGGIVVEMPTIPENVEASVSLSYVFITWDLPTFSGYAHTEIWRSFEDDFVTSVLIGTTNSGIYADRVDYEETAYYWVRHVNIRDVTGPIQSTAGIPADPAESPEEILREISGRITESELYDELNSRIDLIDLPDTGLWDRITAEGTGLWDTVFDSAAGLIARISGLATRMGDAESSIISEQTARSNADGALAQDISQLSTTVGGHTTTLQTQAQSIDGLNASYTFKINNNGHVSGYGLASTTNTYDGSIHSTMLFSVDTFGVAAPGVQALTFAIDTGSNRVVMDGASIKDATITSAKIGSLAADKISAGTVSVALTFNAAHINGGSLNINNKFTVSSAGNVSIRSATSGARMEQTNQVIKVFDGTRLRVQLGNLNA